MEFKEYTQVLNGRKWMIVLGVLVTVAVAIVGTMLVAPTYAATATIRVAVATGGSVEYADFMYSTRLMNTYARIATSGPVLDELAQKLGMDAPRVVKAEIVPETELIRITIESRDAALARDAANALTAILMAKSQQLYAGSGKSTLQILGDQLALLEGELSAARKKFEGLTAPEEQDAARRAIQLKESTYAMLLERYEQARITEGVRANAFSVVEPATLPDGPARPRKEVNIALGFVIGLVANVGLAFVFENLDKTLYSVEQVEQLAQFPVLGEIPTAKRAVLFTGNSLHGDAFRRLRTNLFALDPHRSLRALLMVSSDPGEGKSTTIANLAAATAQAGRLVVLVDGDMRLPTLHTIFGMPNTTGLSNVLTAQVALDEALQQSKVPGLQVLTSGPMPSNPTELIGSSETKALIEELLNRFDTVFIDSPALLSVSDASALSALADGVLMVVQCGQTRQRAIRSALQQLENIRAKLIGVVVNRVEPNSSYFYYRGNRSKRNEPQSIRLEAPDVVEDRV